MDDVIVAIDPGRAKSGYAVMTSNGRVVHKGIVSTDTITAAVESAVPLGQVQAFAVGDGTAEAEVRKRLVRAGVRDDQIFRVDETNSSEIGRREYWRERPPTGWRRLIPVGLQVPPEPYDDFAAVELGRRFLASTRRPDTRSSP